MTELRETEDIRRRMHDAVVGGLSDEGVLSMGAMDILLTELKATPPSKAETVKPLNLKVPNG